MTSTVSTPAAVRAHRVTIAAFAALVGLIGTNLVAIRIGNRELDPLWNAGFRFTVAAVLFWAIAAVRRTGLPTRRAAAGAAAYGLLSIAAFFGFLYAGLVSASVGIATATLALGPLITLGLAAAIGLERLRSSAVVGAAIAFAGIAVMYASALTGSVPITSLLLLVSLACVALGSRLALERNPQAVKQQAVQHSAAPLAGRWLSAGSALARRWRGRQSDLHVEEGA